MYFHVLDMNMNIKYLLTLFSANRYKRSEESMFVSLNPQDHLYLAADPCLKTCSSSDPPEAEVWVKNVHCDRIVKDFPPVSQLYNKVENTTAHLLDRILWGGVPKMTIRVVWRRSVDRKLALKYFTFASDLSVRFPFSTTKNIRPTSSYRATEWRDMSL